MKKVALLLILPLFVVITVCGSIPSVPKGTRPVINIILMIGDGMGTSQIYAGYTLNHGHLNLERIRNIGFSKTHSTSYVTDSGAGGTAISTGNKTYNGAIGVDSTGKPVKTILEWAEEYGKATGLVATCAITHATPASFISHQAKRSDYELIADDFMKTDIDVFIGGGRDHFQKRKDSVDLTAKLRDKGYTVAYTIEDIKNVQTGPVAGFLAPVHQPKWLEGRGNQLTESVNEAIRLLASDKDGFFLMIEGSQIDWGGHANDINYLATEMVDFDNAIGAVLDFALKNGETLVIVTADHETGGLGLNGGNLATGEIKAGFTGTGHTGVMVPVFSYGPHSEIFTGFQENTDLFFKMMDAFGFRKNIK
ncbi:MAG: alkaline phosphatase [Bacteroidales bacterium]